jgi:glycosyltransferase involved in cell wall biosynthesis
VTAPRRVLWLAKGLGRGGAEQLLATGAVHLDRTRFEVEVAYVLPHKDALVEQLQSSGVPVHCLGGPAGGGAAWVLRLRRLLRDGRFDVVHTHMPVPAVAARLLAGRRTALVHTEHNVWQRYRRPTRWANALTYRRNAAVVGVSEAVVDSIAAWARPGAPSTVEVLLHGVDHRSLFLGAAARTRARAALGLAADDLVVGSVGNLTAKKDQRTLLAALALVRRRHPRARLVLVGTGPLERELRDETTRLGLDDAVMMTGMRDDVPALLPGFDVFCLSSRHEGLPISLLEAMGSEVAAVCTDVGGIAQALRPEVDGLLVPAGDPLALAGALDRVLGDPDLRARLALSAAERSRAFDVAVATRRMEDLYDEVLARR